MAFTIDGIVIDRIQYGIAEDFSGNPLYVLTQLTEASISVTSESKESRDATGSLIKKFYTGKSGTFTATNALIDFNIMAESTGTPKKVASTTSKITMPGIKTVPVGSATTVTLSGVKEGKINVMKVAPNGTMIKVYTKDTAATEDAYSIVGEVLTLPTDTTVQGNYVIKYDREVSNGIEIANRTDKFPRTIKLTLKALAVDPCDASTVRSCLIVLPSFQVSPDVEFTLSTEATLNYTGDLQTSFCGNEKENLGIRQIYKIFAY